VLMGGVNTVVAGTLGEYAMSTMCVTMGTSFGFGGQCKFGP